VVQVIEHLIYKGLPTLEAQNPEFNPSLTKINLLIKKELFEEKKNHENRE
jgi:hypothetical protein